MGQYNKKIYLHLFIKNNRDFITYAIIASKIKKEKNMAHKKILSKEITKPKYTSWDQLTEYRNLDMAREIAQHVEKGDKLWTFPYLRQILVIWGVFFRSLYLTTKKSRANGEKWDGGITSSYLVTNLFVLGMTTIEYSVKSLATTVVMLFMVIPQAYHSMMKKRVEKQQAI